MLPEAEVVVVVAAAASSKVSTSHAVRPLATINRTSAVRAQDENEIFMMSFAKSLPMNLMDQCPSDGICLGGSKLDEDHTTDPPDCRKAQTVSVSRFEPTRPQLVACS